MDPAEVGIRFIIAGRVQGVFFRASAAREAARLGVRGHAVNLPDGGVEVLAIGTRERLEEFARWLRRGPPAARVERVDTQDVPAEDFRHVSGFRTG
jgi:acylphosphatase